MPTGQVDILHVVSPCLHKKEIRVTYMGKENVTNNKEFSNCDIKGNHKTIKIFDNLGVKCRLNNYSLN